MNIRDARGEDAEAIRGIWNAVIRDSTMTFTDIEKTAAEIAGLINAAEVFLAAEDEDSHVIGFCTMGTFRGGPGYAQTRELTLHLAPQARHKGTGRALVAALEVRARALGIHTLIGAVSGSNPGAVAFHRALGFGEVGHLPGVGQKFGRKLDLVLLLKFLSPP